MALEASWALHQRISPARWCVTCRELHLFVAEVRRRCEHNEALTEDEDGPDLYQVNEHVVKPVTLAAGDLSESPFAKALEKASHLLVVPNPTVGVYSRLWCVYEAYLGVQMHKTYLLPVKPRTSRVVKTVMWNLVPSFCGILSGIPMMVAFEWSDKTALSSTGYVFCFFYWILSAAVQFCILMADDRSRHLKCIFRCLLSMTFLGWGISMPWLRWCDAEARMKYSDLLLMAILHYGGPLNMTLTNTVIVYFFSRQQAEDEESRHQEAMVQFQSVRSAHCSCPHDEQRIRLAIEGSEDEVDKVIGILVKAGAYTDQLREAYEMGNDMQGAGYTNLLSSSMVAMLGWTFVAADSVSDALLVQKMQLSRVWLRDGFLVLAAICCVTIGTVFLSMLWANCHGPDRAVFVVRSWATCAIWTLLLPLLTSLFFGYDEALLSPLKDYVDFDHLAYIQPPSEEVMLFIFVPRAMLVALGWISAFTNPLGWRRPWMKGLRKRMDTYCAGSATSPSSSSSTDEAPG